MLLVIVTFVGAALRLYRLGHQSLWTDEILTYLSSRGTATYVLTQSDVKSNILPLYYLVVNGALRLADAVGFADRDTVLRLPSVLFSVLTIPLLFFVLQPLLGRSVALQSAGVMAISPFHVWYGQEARPYALLLLLSLVTLGCLQRALARPTSLGWRVAFAFSAASLVYCHTVGLAFVGFLALYLALTADRRQWARWAAMFTAIALLLVPAAWRLYVVPPTASANPDFAFNPVHMVYGVWSFAVGYSLGPSVADLHAPDRMTLVLHDAPLLLVVLSCFAILCVSGALRLLRRHDPAFRMLLLWFVAPMAFAGVGSLVTVHPFNVRYAILSYPPFVAATTLGISGFTGRWARRAAWGAVAVVSAVSLYGYFYVGRYYREDNRAAGQYLSAHASPGDLVIASAPYTVQNLTYYHGETRSTIVGYPERSRLVEPSRIAVDLDRLILGRDHFWLFLSRTFHSDPAGDLGRYCEGHFRRDVAFEGNGVALILYRRPT